MANIQRYKLISQEALLKEKFSGSSRSSKLKLSHSVKNPPFLYQVELASGFGVANSSILRCVTCKRTLDNDFGVRE